MNIIQNIKSIIYDYNLYKNPRNPRALTAKKSKPKKIL